MLWRSSRLKRRPSPLRLRTLEVEDLPSANLLITTESKGVLGAVLVQPRDCAPQARHRLLTGFELLRRSCLEPPPQNPPPTLRRREPRRVNSAPLKNNACKGSDRLLESLCGCFRNATRYTISPLGPKLNFSLLRNPRIPGLNVATWRGVGFLFASVGPHIQH